MARKTLLISIKPRYAEMIFSGVKTVELRRKEPRVGQGDRMVVYVSSPIMEVTGECTVAKRIPPSGFGGKYGRRQE
jgi:predicted transcriptional regulator